MTREERENALHCLRVMVDEEVCEECKLYGTTGTDHCEADCVRVAIEALEQEPNTWSLDDAREDFMHDVYNTLDFLPTNEEANQIIDSFDRVTSSIKQEPRWIPVKTRPLTDAEKADMLEHSAYYQAYMFDCKLPEDGEEVLITTSAGEVTTTAFCNEGLDGCYFECYEDDGEVTAWMPLPQPYKAESEGV